MFPSYLENPRNCRFQGQDSDEVIILLLRAHPITNLSWIIPAVLVFLLPFFLPQLALYLGFNLFTSLPDTFLSSFLIINYLLVLVIVFEGFLGWYFNVNILTNKKLVDIDFHSLLFSGMDITLLASVQEANPKVAGLMGVIFHFGDVMVQTAGARVEIDFPRVPNPNRVADIIMDEAHKAQGGS
ncbi:hypothetical protein HY386_01545 [Candidatus Daviesbacteria bacterium]|nr:hypothetical protein [Candidatus Daviesbacteria bacterium]